MSDLVLLTADLKGESGGFMLNKRCFVFLITPRHSLTLWRGFTTNCDFLKMSNYFWICGKIQTESNNDLCLISSLSYMCFLKQDPMLVQQKRKDFIRENSGKCSDIINRNKVVGGFESLHCWVFTAKECFQFFIYLFIFYAGLIKYWMFLQRTTHEAELNIPSTSSSHSLLQLLFYLIRVGFLWMFPVTVRDRDVSSQQTGD